MRHLVSFFKYARIVDPNKARLLLDVEAADEQAVAAGEVGLSLIGKLATVFPVLRHRDDLSKRLESELPAYLVALQYARQASGLSAPERSAAVSAWWAAHAADLPAWAELARLVFFGIANKRCRRARIQHPAQNLRCPPEDGSRRLRGDFPHAPVQQPAGLWPPAPLVRRGRHSTAVWRRAAAEKTGRKRRI